MLISEEKELLNKIQEHLLKAESDYKAGLITEEQYQEVFRLFDEAEAKIEEMSRRAEVENELYL